MEIPGYKVLRWERVESGAHEERFLKPLEYPELALATTGTHDTETLTTYWSSQPESERCKLTEALGISDSIDVKQPLDEAGLDAIIGSLYTSPARLVVLPIQDLFGWSEQINRPGTVSETNWRFRLPFAIEERLMIPAIRSQIEKLCALAKASGRA